METPSISPPTTYGNVIESHWTRDLDGNVISTMGQIQPLPSDAGTADLENLESVPLPPDTTPPPPPLRRTAQLPSTSSSGGPSGRNSRMGSLPKIPESDSWEENALLKEPSGNHWTRARSQTIPAEAHIRRLRSLMSQPQSQPSPPSRVFLDQPVSSSPLPTSPQDSPTDMSNKFHTFSPFRSNSSNATRRGSSLTPQMHHEIPFEPQSTSTPPRSTSRSPPETGPPLGACDPRSNSVSKSHPPHGPADAPPPRQSPVALHGSSFTNPPSRPYPELYNPAQYTQVPVNLPRLWDSGYNTQHESMFDSRHRPATSNEHHQSQPPLQTHQDSANSIPSHVPPPPQWPGYEIPYPHPPPCPPGQIPYPVAETIVNGYAWDGYAWRPVSKPKRPEETGRIRRNGTKGSDPRPPKDKSRKEIPAASSRPPLAPSQAQNGVPTDSSPIDDALESMQRRLDTLHRLVIHNHWTNLDSYFQRQTDPAFIAFVGPHTSVSSRIRRLLDKLLRLLAGALADHAKLQTGSEHWHGSWRKQLSSLDRMLDKVLAKLNQYEAKFRDLTKKTYTLLNRLRLRAVHSDLVKAHSKAQEQLRTAGSRRDLPGWEEDKRHRAKLREDFISLQNNIALSRRPSWAVSQSPTD
ncbi:hypothetical protein C0992_007489 [Termitomyces sp. T32_za158]|nr:hypothetical protein C0992_007489 [Termitomyces sp. T32_za158]